MPFATLQPGFQQPFTAALYDQLQAICESVTHSENFIEEKDLKTKFDSRYN
jgi:hypothetical protein